MRTKKITKQFLEKHRACYDGQVYWKDNPISDPFKLLNHLIKTNEKEKLQWVNWLIVRLMNKKQKVQYAIYAAEQVIGFFDKEYPNDDRPRKAIKAAKKYLRHSSSKNKSAAYDAAVADAAAAAAAADAAYAAAAAAAADAAYAAAAAAYAADAAAYAAYAADAADAAADYNKTLIKILKQGIKTLK